MIYVLTKTVGEKTVREASLTVEVGVKSWFLSWSAVDPHRRQNGWSSRGSELRSWWCVMASRTLQSLPELPFCAVGTEFAPGRVGQLTWVLREINTEDILGANKFQNDDGSLKLCKEAFPSPTLVW